MSTSPSRPVLLLWQGLDRPAGQPEPDPDPVKDWAMVSALLAWTAGHGNCGGLRPAGRTLACTGCKTVLFEVAPVEAVAA